VTSITTEGCFALWKIAVMDLERSR